MTDMNKPNLLLITTMDQSHTLYLPSLGEQYHSRFGAIGESSHVFIKNGYEATDKDPLHIFEVGFGTGLNVLLTLLAAAQDHRIVFYTAIDNHPLEKKIYTRLNYPALLHTGPDLFLKIHEAPWGEEIRPTKNFRLKKIAGDFLSYRFSSSFDLVYFDAFGPGKQPEMWTDLIMQKIFEATNRGGIFVTYAAKGAVRRSLAATGFRVERLAGPPGKREMLRAIKPL